MTLESHDSNHTILNGPILDSETPVEVLSAVKQRGREKKGPPDIAPKSFSPKGPKWCCSFHRSHREICTRNRQLSETKSLDDFCWLTADSRVGNQPAPYRALSGLPDPKCRESLENVSWGLRPGTPKKSPKSRGQSGKSPESLRKVSGVCFWTVPKTFWRLFRGPRPEAAPSGSQF